MYRLKDIIDQYGRWNGISIYVERIEKYVNSDFSLALENAKSLLETIGREICTQKNVEINSNTSVSSIVKKSI